MAKVNSDTSTEPAPKRYRSIAEVKRNLFPDAAAEERSDMSRRSYENLVAELFEQKRASAK